MYGSVVSVAPKCRRLERLTSVANQLARSPDQPKLPNLLGSPKPKSYRCPKNKNYRLPPQKHSLYELPPACEPAAPELELLAIHGPTKLQSGHFALFRYEKRNILFHGGKKSKSE